MILVVDASLAVKVISAEPGSETADAFLEGHTLLAPELILAEVGNVLWRKVRMGSLSPAMARPALAQLQDWLEPLIPLHQLSAQALDLAFRRDHPVYDCFYVALAMRQAAPLVTGDRRLAERFAGDADIRLIA